MSRRVIDRCCRVLPQLSGASYGLEGISVKHTDLHPTPFPAALSKPCGNGPYTPFLWAMLWIVVTCGDSWRQRGSWSGRAVLLMVHA